MRCLKSLFAATCLLAAAPALAQLEAYRFDAKRVPVGQVLEYTKSRLDGSHAANVSIYVASMDHVEALKWERGGVEATLVVADMDWSRFSVRAFEAWQLSRGAAPQKRATLTVNGDQLSVSFVAQPLKVRHFPWHSYDFDFTSLALTLPHRVNPKRELVFSRLDYVHGETPAMVELGEIRLRYLGDEKRNGVPAWKYTLGGPGLEGKSGDWWVDACTGLTLEYEMPIGDEPGYDDVRFRLESRRAMTPAEWQALKLAAVAGS